MVASVWLYWIPVGASQHVVRRSARVFETLDARRHHRPKRTLYHAALEVQLDEGRWTVEMAPAWGGGPPRSHGVTATGPVGFRRLGASRLFRCEVRVWRDGAVPDLGYAVGTRCTSPPTTRAPVGCSPLGHESRADLGS